MINILPIEDKKELKKAYFKRLSSVALFFVFISLVAAIIVLVPTMLFLRDSSNLANQELSFVNQKVDALGISQAKPFVDDINKKIDTLKQPNKFGNPSAVIKSFLVTTGGVKISSFDIAVQNDIETVTLSGKSDTRKDLLQYINKLKEGCVPPMADCVSFNNVQSPVSNLLEDKAIDFSITAEVAPITNNNK